MKLFKNILIYQFDDEFDMDVEELNDRLATHPLQECLSQELESYGWLPVFSKGGQYVESINHALFFRLGIEQKRLPRLAIKTAVEKRARDLEIAIDSRAKYKEVEEVILNELVPNALPEQSSMMAYIDLEKGWLVVDATSVKRASTLTAVLRKTLGGLGVTALAPQVALHTVMTDWVVNGFSVSEFAFLDEIELKEMKEEGGTARYRGIPPHSKEIMQNIEEGWQVTRLGLAYNELVSFSLGEDFILKRLRFLDTFQENIDDSDDQHQIAISSAFLQVSTLRDVVSQLYTLCHE